MAHRPTTRQRLATIRGAAETSIKVTAAITSAVHLVLWLILLLWR